MIRERDGIHFDLGNKIVADSQHASGDINFVSHAHYDHLYQGNGDIRYGQEDPGVQDRKVKAS